VFLTRKFLQQVIAPTLLALHEMVSMRSDKVLFWLPTWRLRLKGSYLPTTFRNELL
jgi:hypothetical protein